MRNPRLWITIGCLLGIGTLAQSAATARQAGLWEITTTMNWQKSPEVPGGQGSKLHGGTHTSQVCLTQEMIDDYGVLMPQGRGNCSIENKVVKGNTITGDYVCSGLMAGKGELESVWVDTEHAKGKVHFQGTYLVGNERQPIEWTTESTSTFKSTSCGLIKPKQLPPRPPR